jgi:chromate transport protein ChrA
VALLMLLPKAGAWIRLLPSAVGVIVACCLWRTWRHNFDWENHFPVITLLSVTSTSFTWMFDWVVLLPVVILILCWFRASPARLWWLLGALVIMQPLLVISPGIAKTNFYTIWMPPALWLLYWIGYRTRPKVQFGVSGRFGL